MRPREMLLLFLFILSLRRSGRIMEQALQVEVGREHKELTRLARPNTSYREPVELVDAVAGRATATASVVQVVLKGAIVRRSRPPAAGGTSIKESAVAVIPTKNW